MTMNYNSLFDLMEAFPDEKSCVRHLESLRWPNGVVCPWCGSSRKIYRVTRGNTFKCADCKNQFSVRKGTIFEESRLPLRKWFMASWLVTSSRKGIASTQLAREIGVTQKTAWFMLGRLREVAGVFSSEGGSLDGTVEADETYMGGTEQALRVNATVDELLTAAVTHVPRALLDKWTGRTHCGDSVEIMDRMPAESVGLIVTSPPYNIRNSTGNGLKDGRGGKWKNAALINGYADHDDAMPHNEYVEWQRSALAAMLRVLRPDGAIFYNHKWRVQGGLLQDRSDIVEGFPVRQIIIWQRDGGINFNPGYFLPTYEVIYLICKPKFRLAPKANALGDVWRIPQENNNPHPAPFPLELAQRCIQSTTAEIVLDPFMGSGQTAIAAEALGREWIGIDISKNYCKLARERVQAARRLYRRAAKKASADN